MSSSVVVRTLDHVIEVRLQGDAQGLETDVRRAWSRCAAEGEEARGRIDVRVGADLDPRRSASHVTAPSPAAAMELLTQAITLAGIEAGAGELLMLHACGLAEPVSGRTVVLVAPSGTGKSTAAHDLGPHWGYLSDETVAVRTDGSLVPYPKPLSLIRGGPWKEQVSPDDLGLLGVDEPVLAEIVLLDRQPTATPRRHRLPVTESLAHLAEHTSYLSRLPAPLHALARALGDEGCERLSYASTADLHRLLRDVLEER